MNIQIRKARVSDVKTIQKFVGLLMEFEVGSGFDDTVKIPWAKSEYSKKYFTKGLTGYNGLILIAEVDGKPVGYLHGLVMKGEKYRTLKKVGKLSEIFLLDGYRRQKIGQMLTEEFFVWAKKKGAERVSVQAYAGNKEAHKFYKSHGFEDYTVIFEKELF